MASSILRLRKKGNSRRFFRNIKASLFRILKMVKKEFRLLRSDPYNLFIALVLPPLIITLFAYLSISSSQNPIPIKTIVISYDSNTFINPNDYTEHKIDNYTIPYVNAVNKSQKLSLEQFYNASEEVYAMEKARNQLLSNKISIIIVLPMDFSEMINWGQPAFIQCIVDSSDIQKLQEFLNAVQDSLNIFVHDNKLTSQFKIVGYEEFSIPPNYNFQFNNAMTLLLPMMIFGISMVLTILVVVREKPIARLLLTPLKRHEILLSKYITYSLILLAQVIILLTSSLLNGLYLVGSLFDLFLALYMIGFAALSMGIFISCTSNTKTEANQLFFAFFILIVILSGIFVPIESMPVYLQVVAYMLPLSHGKPIITGIVTKGKSVFGFDFYWLLGISCLFFVLSFIVFYLRKYEV
ncbi:MAG: ABC transporter permease [Promethearchaeota archaeon]